eukprot:COSAG02_NODE_6456_length_3560_cov_41.391794_1_plen_57_part_10
MLNPCGLGRDGLCARAPGRTHARGPAARAACCASNPPTVYGPGFAPPPPPPPPLVRS